MDTNLKNVQLAELDMPNAAVANRQLNELLRPNGETLEPSDKYEARGPSGSIRIIVDAQRKLTDVDIQRGWGARIPAPRFAEALFRTHVTAIQRATGACS